MAEMNADCFTGQPLPEQNLPMLSVRRTISRQRGRIPERNGMELLVNGSQTGFSDGGVLNGGRAINLEGGLIQNYCHGQPQLHWYQKSDSGSCPANTVVSSDC